MANQPETNAGATRYSGVDRHRVGAWLAERLDDSRWADCTLEPIGAGRSNLTFRVVAPPGAVVLRRPPVGKLAASAHDMIRERTVMSALRATAVPVPRVLTYSDRGAPVDSPCYIMEMVEGVVPLESLPAGWADGPAERARAGRALVDALVALHSIDPADVGLSSLGRPGGFLARQLRRWNAQWSSAQAGGFRTDPDTARSLTALSQRLSGSVPRTQRHTIVHGDYRIDNCVFDAADPGRILAVLDWELATLGDPLADLGLMLAYWCQDNEHPIWAASHQLSSPTRLPGFPSRLDIATGYAAGSGLDVEPLSWYVAFGAFKLAVIMAGIVGRVAAGSVPAEMGDNLDGAVPPLGMLGHHVLDVGIV